MEKNSHYNLCISDLIMGLLFIFILVLLKFMLDFQVEKEDLSKPLIERGRIIKDIAKELKQEGIESEIDLENGVLKLSKIHYFDSGQYELNKKGREDFKRIRGVLFDNIFCYSAWKNEITQKDLSSKSPDTLTKWKKHCQKKDNKYKHGLIDSILIEGHADKTPISKKGPLWKKGIETNLNLAAKRSIAAFETLLEYKELSSTGNYLSTLTNKKEKPLFGITSFGELRSHNKQKDRTLAQIKETNKQDRRIDIRFVMGQPKEIQDLKNLNKESKIGYKQGQPYND